MSVNDIEKAQPKKDTFAGMKTKNVMKLDDIEGTHARSRIFARPRDSNFSTINYNDVTRSGRNNDRCTNPLMPVYAHRDENNALCEIGPVEGSQPASLPSPPDKNRVGITTKDIAGAQSDTKGLGVFAHAKRQNEPWSYNLKIQDIPGA